MFVTIKRFKITITFSKEDLNITNFEDEFEKIENGELKEETVYVGDLEKNHNNKRYCFMFYFI